MGKSVKRMDRETVITHLQIIHTWAEFSRERDLQFFTAKHLEDIAKWADDAIALLKELADKAITDDASIPEQFWHSMRYDPSEDVVACTSCLICGKDIPLRRYESGPRVCSECKEAVTAMKRGD